MKLLLALFSLCAITFFDSLHCYKNSEDNHSFYIKVGSGISSSELVNVIAPYTPWNPSIQGYNTTLGNCPIASFSVGCEVADVIDLEVSASNRSMFEYRQLQMPTITTGSYTREFDLSVTSILFSANFLGKGVPHLNCEINSGKLYPILGAGIGVSNLLITNFRTTGLPPTGDSSPFESFSAENQYTLRQNFTYTLLAGIEYNHHDDWAIGTGYRWFNAGDFNGPEYQRVSSGAAVDLGDDQWSMRFRAQEWFIEFKIFI